MLQPLHDPLKRFFDQVITAPVYIVFQQAGVIYAKNARTGQIEFSGTDAATIIQKAIDAASASGGGEVFIKEGTYTLTKAVEMKPNVVLRGSGVATVLRGHGIFFTTDGLSNVAVKDLFIDNRGISGCLWVAPPAGVYDRWGPSDVVLENLVLYGSNDPAIGGAVIEVRSARRVFIRNCEIAYGGHNGIYITRVAEGYEPSDIVIEGNYIHNNYDDAIDPDYAQYLTVVGNYFIGNELAPISLENNCQYVIFSGNLVIGGRWIAVVGSKYVNIVGNYFHILYPGDYRIRNSEHVLIASNFYGPRAWIIITNSRSVVIIGNHLWNNVYNDAIITVTGGVSGLAVKNNYFNTWNPAANRTERVHPIRMDTTDGANSDWQFVDNFIEMYDKCRAKFTGARAVVRGNVMNRRGYYTYVDAFADLDGTMTGAVDRGYTYAEQEGVVTGIPIDSVGLKQVDVTFPAQYPTGGSRPASIRVYATLVNPTATDFAAVVWVDNITATGFRVNVNVIAASATAGATVSVAWRAVPDRVLTG